MRLKTRIVIKAENVKRSTSNIQRQIQSTSNI
jgi:hypothetical protein